MNKQREFILSPMTDLVHQASGSIACLKGGIEAYPISEYVLQSLFLKLTGFQEQKMKCVCWELATLDYDYRYHRILKGSIGECSNCGDKANVVADLNNAISKLNRDFRIDEFTQDLNPGDLATELYSFYEQTGHMGWMDRAYRQFEPFAWSSMGGDCMKIKAKDHLFGSCEACKNKDACPVYRVGRKKDALLSLFNTAVYSHRNRCAHNLLSQQRNRPSFERLIAQEDLEENYFVRFFLLLMIDDVIVRMFSEWCSLAGE